MTDVKHKGLYAALAAAQGEMGRALKDATNPHFKMKYADLASVCDACMPSLSKHGIAVLQPAFDDDTGRYVKTIFVHGDSGESAECRVPLIVAKNDMQGYGSAVTYARRYGLMGMAGIAPEDDDGNAAAKAAPMIETRQEPRHPAPLKTEHHALVNQNDLDKACEDIEATYTLQELQAVWVSLKPEVAKHNDAYMAKEKRKEELKRKAELTQPKPADLGGDNIPY